uniref:Alpha-2-macroglobulin domain-containing protein n=1 Tax=Salarias fasciatus TaxID=181472 RepID=A0A672JGC3_SALFA
MGFPALQRRTWTRFLCLLWICVEGREATPQYMVAVPGVMEVGSEAQFCASLMHPDEVLVMTVILMSNEANTTLFTHSSSQDFHICSQFTAPLVNSGTTNLFKVEVKGSNFSSVEMRKVSFEVFRPMDPNNNRIGQWLNESSKSKWLEHSYSLNSEAKQGHYKIVTYSGSNNFETYHSFRVKKYVLPKFEVHVNAPSTVNVAQEEFQIEACVKYTYGQSVPGSAEVKVCRRIESYRYRHMNLTDLCSQQTKQLDKKGCTSFTFDVSTFTKLDPKALRDDFNVKVKVEEEGTDKHMRFSYQVGTLSFFDMPASFKQGSVVEGKIRALHYNNTPIPDLPVFLFESWFQNLIQNLTTDSNGTAAFSMRTDTFKGDVHLTVSKKIPLTSELAMSTGNGKSERIPVPLSTKDLSLQVKNTDKNLPCDSKYNVTIKYTIVGEAEGSVDIMYLKKHVFICCLVSEGEVFFTLRVSPEMAPNFKIVAYAVLPSETVIAHRADFNTEKCFSHKVSLEFSPPSTAPGEEIDLQVAAQPNSICGISAVDKSVLIEDASISFALFQAFNEVINLLCHCEPFSGGKSETGVMFAGFRSRGVTGEIAFSGQPTRAVAGQAFRLGSHIPSAPPIETVRNFFPETWIWDLVEVGESGRKDVPLKVPDTITTWETEAFCLSPQGFGLAPRQKFTVFQPFFLELTIPYSIIRGENFELKATVFNYLTSCLMISVTPSPSSDYTLTPLPEQQLTSCLCGSERKTLSWTFNPSALGVVNVTVSAEAVASHISCDNEIVSVPERGRIDVVTRSLIVKPEGTEMSKTYNFLLCPNGDALTDEIDVHLPENVIGGSARASVSVLGDILGRALKNLDGLLRMPYGCGEQNMALLAPNIYILQYLKGTQQLTPAIREKATNFLTSGYQKQLNYKHRDGAYSTFGTGAGNTWLTAFVLRSFAKAQSFIYIDPAQIKESNSWLNHKQKENGCFQQSGKLFNNRMKGGVSDEVTLSAYITAAFLEMNISSNDPVLVRSLSCLKESMSDLSNTYTTALMAYVFSLAGDVDARDRLLQHLDSVAIREGFLHWSQKATETSASLSVEISSYVLLAKLGGSPTVGDLGYASSIVRWLTGQQNSYGGFSSTQDTVVALQALALYSTLVFSPEGSSTVTLQAPSGPLMFEVNPDNKLLYQESALQDVTGKFSLEVNGSACVSAQVSLHYNIPTPRDPTSLSNMDWESGHCGAKHCSYHPSVVHHSRYSGQENSTNMVILDIKVLSGFVPDSQSLNRLQRALLVDRVDHKEDHVLVYLQQLLKDKPVTHRLELVQELPVQNLKPAVVHIYDYYQPTLFKLYKSSSFQPHCDTKPGDPTYCHCFR